MTKLMRPYRGPCMASLLQVGSGIVLTRIEDILQQLEAALREEQEKVMVRKNNRTHVKQWKTKHYEGQAD